MASIALDTPPVIAQHEATVAPQEQVVAPAAAPAKTEKQIEALPQWVLNFFYFFPIIIYIPDMYFTYSVYALGAGLAPLTADNWATVAPQMGLWFLLAAGTVGMSYLFSILAPYQWAAGNKVGSIACWIGVVIATGVTVIFSLAYRSNEHITYAFDATLLGWFPLLRHWALSPIQAIAAFAPPFWGLFWAIVQPARRKQGPSAAEVVQTKEAQIAAIRAEAEIKAAKAAANTQTRAARLGGIVQTARDAGKAITARTTGENQDPPETPLPAPSMTDAASEPTVTADPGTPPPMPPQLAKVIRRGRAPHVETSADVLVAQTS